MRRKLLIVLTCAAAFWVGYHTGHAFAPVRVVSVAEYRYFPPPTDCSRCKTL